MKFVYIIGLLAILSACVKISDADKKSTPSNALPIASPVEAGGDDSADKTRQADAVKPLVQALAEPMKYRVLLPIDSQIQIVQRSLQDGDALPESLPMDLQDGSWVDNSAQSGKDYVYELGYLQDRSFVSVATYNVHVPLDILIDREMVLQKDEVWKIDGRVFFAAGGIITTNGYSFALQTGKIEADQGLIRSFAAGSEAPQGQVGKSGGSVRISARTGEGQIKIEMIGQKGGQGLTGATGNSKLAGGNRWKNTLCNLCNGMSGDQGGAGFRGGNSGNFEIIFFEAHQMTLFHTIQSGAGGAGGPGGAGSDPMPNVNLEQGAQGATGSVGANGDREFSYLQDLSGRKAY